MPAAVPADTGRVSTATRQHRHVRAARRASLLLLVAAALVCAVWITPRASARAGSWLTAPPVKTRTLALGQQLQVAKQPVALSRLGGGAVAPVQTVTLDAGGAFTMVGILCDTPRGADTVVVSLRTSLDGQSWTAWFDAPLERSHAGRGGPAAFSEALWTGPGRLVQVVARSTADAAPVALDGVRLVTLDTGVQETIAEKTVATLRGAAAAIAGVDVVAPATAAVAQPDFVTRPEWGADESLRRGEPVIAPVKMAFIHHTAGGTTYAREDAAALVRGIYAYHTKSLGWSDIGYNFLIDRFGRTYVGRYGGAKQGVVGAQVYGFNTGSTGISVMGTYSDAAPPAAALGALKKLLAWKLELHGLNPLGTATMTCGATAKYTEGSSVRLPVIAGHRDANFTACPGAAFYGQLPSIRKAVGALYPPPAIPALELSAPVFSPNGDGVLDKVKATATATGAAKWTARVVSAGGTTLRTFSGTGAAVSLTWDGKNASGTKVADGTYTLKISVTSVYGSTATKTTTVRLDTTAPKLLDVKLRRPWFSPNLDAWADTNQLVFTPAERCSLRVAVIDESGAVRRLYHDWKAVTSEPRPVTWGGILIEEGVRADAPDGTYRMLVEARDAAGNIRRLRSPMALDRTIGFATTTPATISPNGDGLQDTANVGFTLTRAAAVRMTVIGAAGTVRTVQAGELAAGTRAVKWDGRAGTGKPVASGTYSARIAAVTALGTSNIGVTIVVDRYQPRLSAPATRTVTLGGTAIVNATATDPFSPDVELWCIVTDAKGSRIAKVAAGWVTPGTATPLSWKPTTRGTYTLTFGARDRGGNREYAAVRTTLTVR